VEFAARCGVNVTAMAVRDALDLPVETISKYAVGRRCVYPYYDFQAVRAELSSGRMSMLGWAQSWLGAYQPVFRWSDPLPAIGEVAALIGGRVRRLGRQ
jgi:D-aspartate ligase